MDRRSFLALLSGATIGHHLRAAELAPRKHLILIELQGGNDGLNTLVPYANAGYRKARQHLALPTDQLVKLDESVGLNPALSPLHSAWQHNDLAIVQGLGYDKPNRSHFRSHDIWASGSDANDQKPSGWVSDILGASDGDIQALVFGDRPDVLKGGQTNYISLRRTRTFLASKLPRPTPSAGNVNPTEQHLQQVLRNTLAYQSELQRRRGSIVLKKADDSGRYGDSLFAKQLQDAALLIKTGLAPPTLLLHLKGFDTHSNQLERHAVLLGGLSTALAALREELVQSGHWRNTLVVTWSEFGRRMAENGAGGTDHGTAAPQFVLGGSVRGGLHGEHPSMTDLQNDDMVHKADFRQLYASIASQWWGRRDHYLNTERFPEFDIVRRT